MNSPLAISGLKAVELPDFPLSALDLSLCFQPLRPTPTVDFERMPFFPLSFLVIRLPTNFRHTSRGVEFLAESLWSLPIFFPMKSSLFAWKPKFCPCQPGEMTTFRPFLHQHRVTSLLVPLEFYETLPFSPGFFRRLNFL